MTFNRPCGFLSSEVVCYYKIEVGRKMVVVNKLLSLKFVFKTNGKLRKKWVKLIILIVQF